jgi:hypothetical protein
MDSGEMISDWSPYVAALLFLPKRKALICRFSAAMSPITLAR